jgi:dienelactone hydrolase
VPVRNPVIECAAMSLRRARFFPLLLLVAPVLANGACLTETLVAPITSGGPQVRFVGGSASPRFLDVPFPSDTYLVNGKIAVPGLDAVVKQGSSYLSAGMADQGGFSRVAPAIFYVDDVGKEGDDGVLPADVDPATLPADEKACAAEGSSVFLVDLDASPPTRLPCRAYFATSPTGRRRPTLGVGPARGLVLEPAHTYAAVVTSRVKTRDRRPLQPSADFAKILGGDRSGPLGALYGAAIDKVRAAVGSLGGETIAGLAPYTTHGKEAELFGVRDALEALPVPTLAWDADALAPMGAARFARQGDPLPDGFTATLDEWLGVMDPKHKLGDGTDDPDDTLPVRAHDAIEAVGTAVFDAPNFLRVKPMGYDDPEHATFARDASGKIVQSPDKPTNKVWVTFAIPTAPMPASGYPVVILQHGLSSSRTYMMALANAMCAKGWAVAAIDSLTFGARAVDRKFQTDVGTDWSKAPGATYDGPDGFADPDSTGARNGSFDLFGGLKNIGALRDQMRAAPLDTATLVRILAGSPTLDPLRTGATAPKIDGAKIAYVGDSLGGIQGTIAAAIEPRVSAWVFNVAGGGIITELGVRSPTISAQLALAGAFNFGFLGDVYSEAHPLAVLVQTIAEPGDPLVYAKHVVSAPQPLSGAPTKARNAMLIEVLFDETVSNESTEALARALGIGLATPNALTNAEIRDLRSPQTNARRTPLLDVMPDGSGAIHDTPVTGVTAILVQDSPANHSGNLTRSVSTRQYKAPYADLDSKTPFVRHDNSFAVRTGYREMQGVVKGFFETAFAGPVPSVKGLRAPVRDIDDDGNPDATDPEPTDPTKN